MKSILKVAAVFVVIVGNFDRVQAMYQSYMEENDIEKYRQAFEVFKSTSNPTKEQCKKMFDIWLGLGSYDCTDAFRFLCLLGNIVDGRKFEWNKDYVKSLREAAKNGASSVVPCICGKQDSLLSSLNSFIKLHPDDWQTFEIDSSLSSKIKNAWIQYRGAPSMSYSGAQDVNKMSINKKFNVCLFGNEKIKLADNATKGQQSAVDHLKGCFVKIIENEPIIRGDIALDGFRAWLGCRIIEDSQPAVFLGIIDLMIKSPSTPIGIKEVYQLTGTIACGRGCGGGIYPAIFGEGNSLYSALISVIQHNDKSFRILSYPELYQRVFVEWMQIQELLNQ